MNAANNRDLQLVGQSTYEKERVEICYNSVQGTICDGDSDATIACANN